MTMAYLCRICQRITWLGHPTLPRWADGRDNPAIAFGASGMAHTTSPKKLFNVDTSWELARDCGAQARVGRPLSNSQIRLCFPPKILILVLSPRPGPKKADERANKGRSRATFRAAGDGPPRKPRGDDTVAAWRKYLKLRAEASWRPPRRDGRLRKGRKPRQRKKVEEMKGEGQPQGRRASSTNWPAAKSELQPKDRNAVATAPRKPLVAARGGAPRVRRRARRRGVRWRATFRRPVFGLH